jgi:hypothetical protein
MEKVALQYFKLCRHVKQIFLNENRLIKIESPSLHVLGDIHGNYKDLVCFEKNFWPNGMRIQSKKYLFLGDYVDRGANGIEVRICFVTFLQGTHFVSFPHKVVMHLFALKALYPDQVFLIRGNHEDRTINRRYGFYKFF